MSKIEHDGPEADVGDQLLEARRREMAVEHILFGTVRFLAARHPELLDELDASVNRVWDHGPARDDEAVRDIARRILKGLRSGT